MTKRSLNILTIVLCIISTLCILFLCYYNKTFWIDEAYTIKLIKQSYIDIWNITANDVHPPLYYLILKTFTLLFGSTLFSMRLYSYISILFILIIGLFPIRRLFGIKVSCLFTIIISLLPVTIYLSTDIRMYSWLMFFVLAAAVYGYDAFSHNSNIAYIKLTIFAICASYTHNYGLASTLTIYFILIILLLIKKKSVKKIIISGLFFSLVFIFWIPNLYNQITSVKESYWISPISIKTIINLLTLPLNDTNLITKGLLVMLYLALGFTIYLTTIKKHQKAKQNWIAPIFFISIFAIVLFTTLSISIIIKPILITRYLTSVLGCLILGISIMITNKEYRSNSKFAYLTFICLIALYGSSFYYKLIETKNNNLIQDKQLQYFNENYCCDDTSSAIIELRNSAFTLNVMSLLKPDYNYYYFVSPRITLKMSLGSPFKITQISSLKMSEQILFIINDLNATSDNQEYLKSNKSLSKNIDKFYDVVSIDTIGEIEIKKVVKKNCRLDR